MTTLRIREHKDRAYQLSPRQAAVLEKDFRKEIQLTPTRDVNHFLIQAKSYVGFVQLPGDLTISVEAKIPVNTIFYLLSIVYDPQKSFFHPESQSYTTFQDLFEYVALIFVKHVEDLLARGILRNYQVYQDDLLAIRGKLQLTETLRRHPAVRDRHWCQFSRFTADICENQILKAANLMLKNYRYQQPDLMSRVRRLERSLGEVSFQEEALDLFDQFEYHRLNDHYQPALRLAHLLLEHLTFSGSEGGESFLSFLVDMNWLFEKVIETFMKRWHNSEIKALGQKNYGLDRHSQVHVRPDVTLLRGRRPIFALDAKYKLDPDHKDVYQVLAYCHALGLDKVALAYPLSENIPQKSLAIREPGQVEIHYVPIELSGSPQDIEENARRFVDRIGQLIPYQ